MSRHILLDESCIGLRGSSVTVFEREVLWQTFRRGGLKLSSGEFIDMLHAMRDAVKQLSMRVYGKEPSGNSLSKCCGTWNECLVAWVANNAAASGAPVCFVRLDSNRDGQAFAPLLCDEMRRAIDPERHLASNPDLLVLSARARRYLQPEMFAWLDADRVNVLMDQHRLLTGQLEPGDIRGALAVKVSLRPDRREQFPFGGNKFKAALEKAWRVGARKAGQRIRKEFVPEVHNIVTERLGNTTVLRQQTDAMSKSYPIDSTTQARNARELKAVLIDIGRSCLGRKKRRGIFAGNKKVEDMLDLR